MILMVILGGITESTMVLKIIVSFFYLINPMFTFYLANLEIIIDYLIQMATDYK